MLELLSEDLLPEFLKKLPIDSVCRFRCVSKTWDSLISSSFFIHSFTPSPNQKSYLRVNFRDRNHNAYAVFSPQGNDLVEHSSYELHFPFRFRDTRASDHFTFVDVINGVVCVSYSLDSSFDSTILWNPTIHKYVALPRLPFSLDLETAKAAFDDVDEFDSTTRFESNAIGFGFDRSKNDFKVVRIWIPSCSIEWRQCELPPATYEVYSAREGAWRVSTTDHINIKSCEFNTCGTRASRTGCFMNGTIYWLVSTFNEQGGNRTYSLLMFDCEGEEFTTTNLPKEIYETFSSGPLRLKAELLEYDGNGNENGTLLVLVYSCWSWQRQIELWAMEEDGDIRTWKKMFRIPDGLELSSKSLMNDAKFIHQPLLGKLASNSPSNWMELSWNVERFDAILSYHVYEQSLFLMDDRNAESYTKEEMVRI